MAWRLCWYWCGGTFAANGWWSGMTGSRVAAAGALVLVLVLGGAGAGAPLADRRPGIATLTAMGTMARCCKGSAVGSGRALRGPSSSGMPPPPLITASSSEAPGTGMTLAGAAAREHPPPLIAYSLLKSSELASLARRGGLRGLLGVPKLAGRLSADTPCPCSRSARGPGAAVPAALTCALLLGLPARCAGLSGDACRCGATTMPCGLRGERGERMSCTSCPAMLRATDAAHASGGSECMSLPSAPCMDAWGTRSLSGG